MSMYTPELCTCPTCGIMITVRRWPVRCACGTTLWAPGEDEPRNQEMQRRLAICHDCEHFGRTRCAVIDLGCSRTFRDALQGSESKCPERKWRTPRGRRMIVYPSVRLLNLLYHVCPLKSNDVWRANVRQVVRRLGIFNGRKVVAVATGEKLHGVEVVRRAFDDPAIEYLEIPNDKELREVASFVPLLEAVESTNPEEASFYAHTKGNSTRDNALGAEMWRNQMYHSLLDGVSVCRDLLWTHPCVGTHKMQYPPEMVPFPSKLKHGNWFFAGTFFWFRHQDVYAHPKWRDVPRDRYGAEAWLSGLFDVRQAASVFQPWPASEFPTPSPYDPALYLWPIRDT